MLQNIIGAFGSCAETISLLVFALSMGYPAMASAPAFLVAAAGMVALRQVVPLSIMSEQLAMLNTITSDRRERQNIMLYAGLLTFVLGMLGVLGWIQDFVGPVVLAAMMTGVGILLSKVALDMIRQDMFLGVTSLLVGILTYSLTSNLIYTVTACVAVTAIVYNIFRREQVKNAPRMGREKEKLLFVKPMLNKTVLRGTLAMLALILGEIFADASVSCSIAGWEYRGDIIALYTGLANAVSGIFGGVPLGTIIAGSCAAPDPIFCGVLMMLIIVAVILLRLIPKLAPYIPPQGVAGFIFVVAAFVVFPGNAAVAVSSMPMVSCVTIMVTAFVDPFLGMCAGTAVKYLLPLLGVVL